MFDFHPTRALKQELLAMTPGTREFAARLRAIPVELDAEQARLDCSGGKTNVRLRGRRTRSQRRGGALERSSA